VTTRYGISPWIHQFPSSRLPEYPRFEGNRDARVVIIGGGLTGCVTAYVCAIAGLRPVVLERDLVGQSGSGRSMGLLLPEPGPAFRDIAGAHGLRLARGAFESWRRASLDATALLRRAGIKCALDSARLMRVASNDGETQLRRELEARRAAGTDVTWITPKQLRDTAAIYAPGAMGAGNAFGLDPYRACLGLAAQAVRRGAAIFERSGVKKVQWGRKHAQVVTERGTIRADAVLVTTGTPSAEYKPLRRHFKRRETYLVLTEPVSSSIRKQLGRADIIIRDTAIPPHTIRWSPDNRLLVSGADQAETPDRSRKAVLVQRTGQLMYELLTMYPAISGLKPEYGWELHSGEADDGLMCIGPHRNYPHHLFALGSSSITGSFLAARVLLRALQGTPDKSDAVWSWTRGQ
jgi:glycine/D-amino acid oxidase-like deaminating enzyme